MKLILKGENCGFTWSASHLLPGHFKCSRMHGHNYVMDVEIETGDLVNLKDGMIVDFVRIKKFIRDMIEEYDHRLMLPTNAFQETNFSNMRIFKSRFDRLASFKIIYRGIKDENKIYSIPDSDVVFIDGVDFITAEELSRYFKRKVMQMFSDIESHVLYKSIYVTIYEDNGQGVMA
jgi:6-pyruvoyltetrahydropterin/6-carboxytetrahydropterin synthase